MRGVKTIHYYRTDVSVKPCMSVLTICGRLQQVSCGKVHLRKILHFKHVVVVCMTCAMSGFSWSVQALTITNLDGLGCSVKFDEYSRVASMMMNFLSQPVKVSHGQLL